MIPVVCLVIGALVFVAGSKRYVQRPPERTVLFNTLKLVGKAAICQPFHTSKQSEGGSFSDEFVDGVKRLLQVIPMSLLILPFIIAYMQMATIFIIQGEAMKKLGLLDASMMQNFDPISGTSLIVIHEIKSSQFSCVLTFLRYQRFLLFVHYSFVCGFCR
jgi:hypothetical protein